MKCPHCNKEIAKEDLSNFTKNEIYEEICKSVHSIASLSRKTGIKRSTLVYYLNILLNEQKIYKERLENLTGRPEILKPMGAKND